LYREVALISQDVVAERAYAAGGGRDAESRAFEIVVEAIPDDDVPRGNAGLLEALADCFDQSDARGRAAARQAVHLQADNFVRPRNLFPGLDGGGTLVERLHGAIEQGEQALRIDCGAAVAQLRVAGHDHAGLIGYRGLGE
jgi:hypothetical protein